MPQNKVGKVRFTYTLEEVKEELPDCFHFKGREFCMKFYSNGIWKDKNYPEGRSTEIIWEDKKGNQVYIYEDSIELINLDEIPKLDTKEQNGIELEEENWE